MDILMTKTQGGLLAPLSEEYGDELRKIPAGHVVECKITRKRNPQFHRKFFALLAVGFDAWVETAKPVEYQGVAVLPTRDRFRKDVTILAGYYEPTFNVKGEIRLEPKSISFANMSEDEFEALYSSVINVLLTRILTARGYSAESLREHVDRVLSFDS